jgi:hypothetical protein
LFIVGREINKGGSQEIEDNHQKKSCISSYDGSTHSTSYPDNNPCLRLAEAGFTMAGRSGKLTTDKLHDLLKLRMASRTGNSDSLIQKRLSGE